MSGPALNVLSLFAGIGGLEYGLERAGMTTVGQVELDPDCRSVLAHHWPKVPRHDDVRTAPAWWASRPRPMVDVVAGGFPCQPFSKIGLRRGIADERWGWPWMLDVVRAVEPRYVLVENVPGLLADRIAFGWILADLADLGFDAEWSLLSACAMGAPHTRDRLLLVAYPNSGDGSSRMGLGRPRQESLPQIRHRARAWRDEVGRALETTSPDGREADGSARWLVKAGGNAVVPAVSQLVGELIVERARAAAC